MAEETCLSFTDVVRVLTHGGLMQRDTRRGHPGSPNERSLYGCKPWLDTDVFTCNCCTDVGYGGQLPHSRWRYVVAPRTFTLNGILEHGAKNVPKLLNYFDVSGSFC